eukprot:8949480-Pyramimonas_sp.AAC.1
MDAHATPLGFPDGVGAGGVGGSRRMADAPPMRLDVQPDLRHVDVADASPTSTTHRWCIAVALPMHRR